MRVKVIRQMKVATTRTKPIPLSQAHIGHRLHGIRELMGVTQSELAERLRVGQAALSRLERRADMLVSTMLHYLEALGVDVRIDANLISDVEGRSPSGEFKQGQLPLPIIGGLADAHRRDVVLSIKPEYSAKIVTGKKTVELRRRFSPRVQAGTIVLIYASSPTRALTGIARIVDVLHAPTSLIWKKYRDDACIGRSEFDSYFAGTETGFVIKLRGARPLRRVLELRELRERFSFEPPQSFLYAPPELREALIHECSEIPN